MATKITSLSPRHWDVITLILIGKTNKAIATELFISERTVGSHINIIAQILHFSKDLVFRVQLLNWYYTMLEEERLAL